MMAPQDSADREAARLRLDVNVVVEAGAGTGKTTLLTDRVLFLLLGRDQPAPVAIGALVVLTFTEKAAGEIKLRLSDRLIELSALLSGGGGLAPEARRRAEALRGELRERFKKDDETILARARAALEDMDRAQIGTIHGFASHLLRLYPLQAGVDPGFRVDEGQGFDDLFASEWARWLDLELGEAPPRRRQWLEVLRLADLGALEELAAELCREGLDLGAVGRPDPGAAESLRAAAASLRRAHEGQPPARGKILSALGALANHLESLAAAVSSEDPALPPSGAALDMPNASWSSGWEEGLRALYEDSRDLAESCTPQSEALVRRAALLLLPFARAFRRSYTRVGLVSFDGLLRRARDLVRDHPDVREEVKRRYGALLIDEFQDTDPLQGELLLFLAEAPGHCASRWEEVRLGAGRLFVVGDPKQSIYRFRGADIAAYQRFTEHILASPGALACDLKTNFRSHAGIIDPVNAVFGGVMSFKAGSQPAYKAILPYAAKAPARVEGGALELVCVRPEGEQEKPCSAAASQRAEAAWAAAWVSDHCGPGKPWAYKDVAVLLRSATPLSSLLEAFKARGLPYAVEMERFFFGAQEIIDFVNLLRTLDDPGDRLALAGLLRSPAAALKDGEVYQLARARGLTYLKDPPAGLAKEPRERVRLLYACLRSLRERVGRAPLGELVQAALRETPLLETAARAYHGQQTVSNLLKFGRLAASAADDRGMTLKEFIERLRQDQEEGRQEGESPLADEHLDAVRILSVHKSKGLEFSAVLLMNLSGTRGGAGRSPAALVDWDSGRSGLRLRGAGASASLALIEAREKRRQDDETLRLLYVALTRAKEKLILLGRESGDRSSLSSLLSRAGAWPAERGQGGVLPKGLKKPLSVHWTQPAAGPLRGPAQAGALSPGRAMPPASELAAVWRRRLARGQAVAATAWTTSPTAYLKDAPRRAAWEPEVSAAPAAGAGALVGQICHRVLEGWDFTGSEGCAAAVAAACRALGRSQPEADWNAAAAESVSILEVFLSSPAARELAQAEILGREVPFVYEEDGAVMRGSIDLLYRKDGKTIVADYKTDAVDPAELEKRSDKYLRQGRAYCKAVERALGVKEVGFRLIYLRRPDFP